MYEIVIKNQSSTKRGSHQALNGNEVVARIENPEHRLYVITYKSDDKPIEFRQLKGFTIDHLTFDVYQDEQQIGTVKRRIVKGSYEVNLYEVEMSDRNPFTIKEGWVSRGVTRYTNPSGNLLAIEKGHTGLFDWKALCEDEISSFDIALILFMRAMSGLMIS